MDDTRTMAQLLEAPTVGYEDAIVVPEITADNFELKHGLLTPVQNKQFFGHDKEDPHAHIRYFNKITSTMKFPNVPSLLKTKGVTKNDFEATVKANDAVMRKHGSGTLPCNTSNKPECDSGGNPTPYYDPIVFTFRRSHSYGDSDFLLEEVDAFLALEDDPTSPEVDDSYYDPGGG
ncbi:hypothetical protein Tco_1329289 [Tanacetum coccineum]